MQGLTKRNYAGTGYTHQAKQSCTGGGRTGALPYPAGAVQALSVIKVQLCRTKRQQSQAEVDCTCLRLPMDGEYEDDFETYEDDFEVCLSSYPLQSLLLVC